MTGAVIDEARPGYARVSLKLRSDLMNAAGGVMGGAIFTLADFAFAVATNEPEQVVVSVESNISFLGRAKTGALVAEARVIKSGRSVVFAEITVSDDGGNDVARVSATGMKV